MGLNALRFGQVYRVSVPPANIKQGKTLQSWRNVLEQALHRTASWEFKHPFGQVLETDEDGKRYVVTGPELSLLQNASPQAFHQIAAKLVSEKAFQAKPFRGQSPDRVETSNPGISISV